MNANRIGRADILRVALANAENNERPRFYLSHRHYTQPIGTVPAPDSIEQTWEAAQELVGNGLARFLTTDEGGPGIELTSKGMHQAKVA